MLLPANQGLGMKANAKRKVIEKKTILLHSADKDLTRSLSILLQDEYKILATRTVEELALQRTNKDVSLLIVDLERSIPALLAEFDCRHRVQSNAPIIVLYAFRQGQPEWERKIRLLGGRLLYKPVQIEQILEAVSIQSGITREVHET